MSNKEEGVFLKKTIQVGSSDFKEMIDGNYYFVDKTMLIKEFIENGAKIILVPRPRHFGKTLNLSMLRYFFYIDYKEENKNLFQGLNIENENEIMKHQGQYPVIFLTFKNQKYDTFKKAEKGMRLLLLNLFEEYDYLLNSEKLSVFDKEFFCNILRRQGDIADVTEALSMLIKFLYKHHGKKVMLFIDEYDVPIQESYNKGYYDEMISFMQIMFTSALKDNTYLEKSMVTGILRIAKESIFSGLNNIQVNTIFKHGFNDKFGFIEDEVDRLLKYYNLNDKSEEVKNWYNGYVFSGEVIYNPWSVLNYVKSNKDGFMPYWINSSSNDLIKKLLSKGSRETKENLEDLIQGKFIKKVIDDHIVMKEVEEDEENLWSFLALSGYLKPTKIEVIDGELHCTLKIPNKEVLIFYNHIIEKWFKESLTSNTYNTMLKALITGDIEVFEEIFSDFVLNNMSYFDVSGKQPEKVYHAFVLGILVSLSKEYEVKSNKESGYGRYDVMIIPKDELKPGIIIEFKRIKDTAPKTIEQGIKEALEQIEEKRYEVELHEKNIKNIIKLAIVFKGKQVRIIQG